MTYTDRHLFPSLYTATPDSNRQKSMHNLANNMNGFNKAIIHFDKLSHLWGTQTNASHRHTVGNELLS